MKVCIFGAGQLGNAVLAGFSDKSTVVQVSSGTSKDDMLGLGVDDADAFFICVPAPVCEGNQCNDVNIRDCIEKIIFCHQNPMIVIKSTLTPDCLEYLAYDYSDFRIVYNPEMNDSVDDVMSFMFPHMFVFGGDEADTRRLKEIYTVGSKCLIREDNLISTDYSSACLLKFAISSYFATKITFMNFMHQIHRNANCGTEWEEFREMLSKQPGIGNQMMDIQAGHPFTQEPFVSDINAFVGYASDFRLLKLILKYNDKFKEKGAE